MTASPGGAIFFNRLNFVKMGKWRVLAKKLLGWGEPESSWKKPAVSMLVGVLEAFVVDGQDGNAGINQANTMVRSYFATGVNLMYAIGAILGLIGAVRVYQKWSHGDHDTGKVAASWFGACIFLVVVATLIQSFFGL
jgi:hypothetical protein